jgi:hypothetical protein
VYFCVCVRACVRARLRDCATYACVRVGEWALHVFALVYPYYSSTQRHAILHRRPLWLHHILRHYLIHDTIFGTKVTESKMCIMIFSTTSVSNISHSKKDK